MTTKQWKQKIAEQKKADMQRKADLMRRKLSIKDINVVVEMGDLYVKNEELEEVIEDILKTTKGCTLKADEIFKTSTYCDCMFDLKFLGINKEKVLIFKLIWCKIVVG